MTPVLRLCPKGKGALDNPEYALQKAQPDVDVAWVLVKYSQKRPKYSDKKLYLLMSRATKSKTSTIF